MENLQLSIIVPIYNAEAGLKRCLDSLVNITYKDEYEVVLIDDGSKDCSSSICDEYNKKYDFFKVIHQKNAGVSAARNAGIELATGKYIMFVDSDDYLSPLAIKIIFNEVVKEFDFAIFLSYDIKNKKNNYIPELQKYQKTYNVNLDSVYSAFLKLHSNVPFAKLFFNKTIKNNQVKFPTDISLGEDLIFNLKMLRLSKCVNYIPEALYMHDESTDGLSKKNRFIESVNDFDKMYKELLEFTETMKLNNSHRKEVIKSILQSVTNYSGKLYNNGYSKENIYTVLSTYSWYDMILKTKYCDFKSNLRKVLLKHRYYFIISKIFKC